MVRSEMPASSRWVAAVTQGVDIGLLVEAGVGAGGGEGLLQRGLVQVGDTALGHEEIAVDEAGRSVFQ